MLPQKKLEWKVESAIYYFFWKEKESHDGGGGPIIRAVLVENKYMDRTRNTSTPLNEMECPSSIICILITRVRLSNTHSLAINR